MLYKFVAEGEQVMIVCSHLQALLVAHMHVVAEAVGRGGTPAVGWEAIVYSRLPSLEAVGKVVDISAGVVEQKKPRSSCPLGSQAEH
jgi:hypothetical protein